MVTRSSLQGAGRGWGRCVSLEAFTSCFVNVVIVKYNTLYRKVNKKRRTQLSSHHQWNTHGITPRQEFEQLPRCPPHALSKAPFLEDSHHPDFYGKFFLTFPESVTISKHYSLISFMPWTLNRSNPTAGLLWGWLPAFNTVCVCVCVCVCVRDPPVLLQAVVCSFPLLHCILFREYTMNFVSMFKIHVWR